MTARTRVAVVGGGQSCEHDVSLASAASVRDALDPTRFEVVGLTIGRDGVWAMASGRRLGTGPGCSLAAAVRVLAGCAAVVPVVHGPRGEDGTLAGLCELAGVPYVGSDLRAGALAMDKWATKLVARAVGVRVAAATLVTRATAAAQRFDGPVVVKPVAAGSSHGVSLVTSAEQLPAALDRALALDERALVEERLVGREVDVAVLERRDGRRLVSPALEISVDDGLFDTERKYDGSAVFHLPAALAPDVRRALEESALRLHEALGCAGVARYDFFLTRDGVVLNEVNTVPGMTPASQVPRMFAAAGLAYPDLLAELVEGAVSA